MRRFSTNIILKIPIAFTGITTIVFVFVISIHHPQYVKNTFWLADHTGQVRQHIQQLTPATPDNETRASVYLIDEFHQLPHAFKKNFSGNQVRLKKMLAKKLLVAEKGMCRLIFIDDILPDNKILV